MRIKIEFTTWQAKRFVERQVRPVVYVGFTAIIAGWFVALFAALHQWLSFDVRPNEPGWIIIWIVVSAAWGGYFLYLDQKKDEPK